MCDALLLDFLSTTFLPSALLYHTEFSPSPESFSISNETPTSLNLSWSIPFPQVVPDSFSLDYDINKLSGAPATTTTDSLTIDISNTSVTDNGGSFSYLLEELTAHTEYSFSLSSNYGSSTSAPITASAVTDQDSKMILTCPSMYNVHYTATKCTRNVLFVIVLVYIHTLRVRVCIKRVYSRVKF